MQDAPQTEKKRFWYLLEINGGRIAACKHHNVTYKEWLEGGISVFHNPFSVMTVAVPVQSNVVGIDNKPKNEMGIGLQLVPYPLPAIDVDMCMLSALTPVEEKTVLHEALKGAKLT